MKRYFTGAGLILSDDHTRVLLIFHKKYNLWLPPGGLREDDELAHEVALREVKEEVGLEVEIVCTSQQLLNLGNPLEKQLPTPLFVMHYIIAPTDDTEEHVQIDCLYQMRLTSQAQVVSPSFDEVSDIGWFNKQEVMSLDTSDAIKNIAQVTLKDHRVIHRSVQNLGSLNI